MLGLSSLPCEHLDDLTGEMLRWIFHGAVGPIQEAALKRLVSAQLGEEPPAASPPSRRATAWRLLSLAGD